MQGNLGLLDLPEEVICTLLHFLDATSLYLLARTCTHLDEIIKNDITLWRRIDARRSPNVAEKISYCLDRCYDDGNTFTHTFLIRGDVQEDLPELAPLFPRLNSFSKLTILACENQAIDGFKYNVMAFPPQLEELSLKRTKVSSGVEFFKGSGDHFKNLRVLLLDQCDWLTTISFMAISKYRSLEIFSVYKCGGLKNSIAYLSLSSQGFKTLKILDARLSPLGNSLIGSLYRNQSIQAIYLQNTDITYQLDYFRRKLDIARGQPSREFFKDDEFAMDEEDGPDYGEHVTLDDNGLLDYLSVHSDGTDTKLPSSVLYLDPYNPCTCGFEDIQNTHHPQDGDEDDDSSPFRFLSWKVSHLTKLVQKNIRSNGTQHPVQVPPWNLLTFLDDMPAQAGTFCMSLGSRQRDDPVPPPDNPNRSIVKLYIYPQVKPPSEGPPAKRMRTEDPAAGPSGLNAYPSSSESEDDDLPQPHSVYRPPTPHPDVAVNSPPNERNAAYRIYFRDRDSVLIENLKDINRDLRIPLKRLSLRGYGKITDVALGYISSLELELLDLTYTGVTVTGIMKYLKSHPLCRVVHEKFCTCLPNLHF